MNVSKFKIVECRLIERKWWCLRRKHQKGLNFNSHKSEHTCHRRSTNMFEWTNLSWQFTIRRLNLHITNWKSTKNTFQYTFLHEPIVRRLGASTRQGVLVLRRACPCMFKPNTIASRKSQAYISSSLFNATSWKIEQRVSHYHLHVVTQEFFRSFQMEEQRGHERIFLYIKCKQNKNKIFINKKPNINKNH